MIRLIIWIEIWNKTVRRHHRNGRAQSTLVFLWAQVWTGAGFKRTAIINDAPNVTSVVFPSNGKVQRWEPLNNPWKRGVVAHEQKLHIGHHLIDKISELVWLGFFVDYETNGTQLQCNWDIHILNFHRILLIVEHKFWNFLYLSLMPRVGITPKCGSILSMINWS